MRWQQKNCNEVTLVITTRLMKKRSGRRKHGALVVARRSQKKLPRCRPLHGCAERPKFNQMVTAFTYRPSLMRIDSRNFELSW